MKREPKVRKFVVPLADAKRLAASNALGEARANIEVLAHVLMNRAGLGLGKAASSEILATLVMNAKILERLP